MTFFYVPEKLNVSMILDGQAYTGLPGEEETLEIKQSQNINKQDLCIPRRSVVNVRMKFLFILFLDPIGMRQPHQKN